MIHRLVVLLFTISVIVGCEKDDFSWNLSKKPVVVTKDEVIYSDSSMTLLIKGEVLKDEGNPITQRGFVWSNSPNPTLSNNYSSNGIGIGFFSSNINGLLEKTTYYFRAYATNSIGTSYGEELIFTIPSKTPIISTSATYNITTTSAFTGGTISSEGAGPITQRGVVWSNSPNPTLANNYTSNGIGTGVFTSAINGLNPSTKYYVRAYATNNFGTSYGNQVEIQTLDPVPVLISTNPCNSLFGISSSYEHWHFSSNDSHSWSVHPYGYIGNCFASDDDVGGYDSANSGYIEFPLTINSSGYLTFWIRSGTSGTGHGSNRIPLVILDGIELPTPTVIGGQSEYDWQKIKTSQINNGNHVLRIYFYPRNNIGNAEDLLKIDEIELWELQ